MTKADRVETYLRSKVGCGYVMGATGWVCSEARRAEQAKNYPQYAQTIMSTCAKWDGLQCFDCAQLVVQAMKEAGVSNLPSGATSLWKKVAWADKGTIDTAPAGQLICLYRDSNGTKEHVGWRLRNGDVIDARGSASGVVLNKPYSAWTHWSMYPGLNEEDIKVDVQFESQFSAQVVKSKVPLSIRASRTVESSKLHEIPVGGIVEVGDAQGDWWLVRYQDVVGYASSKYLTRVNTHAECGALLIRDEAGNEFRPVGRFTVEIKN